MKARVAPVTVAVLAVLAGLMPAAIADGTNPTRPDPGDDPTRKLIDSRRLRGPVAVQGTIVTRRGEPARGATVYLMAWPRVEDLAVMEVGDPLDLEPIAVSAADADGRYALRIAPGLATDGFWSDAGAMDVDLVAVLDGVASTHSFSVVSSEGAEDDADLEAADRITLFSEVDEDRTTVDHPLHLDLELGNPEGARLGGQVDEATDPLGAAALEAIDTNSLAAAAPTISGGRCPGGAGLKANLGDRWVNVGSVHISTSGKDMRFTYTGTASSSLGVGISGTGLYGSFSVGGTVARSRASSTSFPWYKSTTQRFLDTLFSYAKYCVDIVGGGHAYHQYQVRAVRHEGGTRGRTTSAPTANHCVAYHEAGSGGQKTSSDAITWTNGAKVSGAIGIDLSSRTGYRTDSKIEYVFRTAGRLCGTHDKPNGTPRRLVMRPL